MPQLINYGNEILRVSPKGVEYSTIGGRSWNSRYSGTAYGSFIDLLPYGNELLAVTTKGVYYSTTGDVHGTPVIQVLPMVLSKVWQMEVENS